MSGFSGPHHMYIVRLLNRHKMLCVSGNRKCTDGGRGLSFACTEEMFLHGPTFSFHIHSIYYSALLAVNNHVFFPFSSRKAVIMGSSRFASVSILVNITSI